MMTTVKLAKFIERLQGLIEHLNEQRALHIHQHVNQFYYMQRREELKTLLIQLEQAQEKYDLLVSRIEGCYTEAFCSWRKDLRWLLHYYMQHASSRELQPDKS